MIATVSTLRKLTERSLPFSNVLTFSVCGFHSPGALIALARLTLAKLCPPLPGR